VRGAVVGKKEWWRWCVDDEAEDLVAVMRDGEARQVRYV
jgi:hypothetical protein